MTEQRYCGLKLAIELADQAYELTTGLSDFDRRMMAYYAVATHYVDSISPFPQISVQGPLGTGKTAALRTSVHFCCGPVYFPAKVTSPVLRERLASAHDGTAIIDEGDWGPDDMEYVLTLRYDRETAVIMKMKRGGDDWEEEEYEIFGPTIVSRRSPIADTALESRTITIKACSQIRNYQDPNGPEVSKRREVFQHLVSDLPAFPDYLEILEADEILPRVRDRYRPILALADAVNDMHFIAQLMGSMEEESRSVRDSQTYETGPLLLLALIAASNQEGTLVYARSVPIEGCLLSWVFNNHRRSISPWQGANILRGYGFRVAKSGGVNCVFIEDIGSFVQLCREEGIEDEVVENEAKTLGL